MKTVPAQLETSLFDFFKCFSAYLSWRSEMINNRSTDYRKSKNILQHVKENQTITHQSDGAHTYSNFPVVFLTECKEIMSSSASNWAALPPDCLSQRRHNEGEIMFLWVQIIFFFNFLQYKSLNISIDFSTIHGTWKSTLCESLFLVSKWSNSYSRTRLKPEDGQEPRSTGPESVHEFTPMALCQTQI